MGASLYWVLRLKSNESRHVLVDGPKAGRNTFGNPCNAIKETINQLSTSDNDSNSRVPVKIEIASEMKRDWRED